MYDSGSREPSTASRDEEENRAYRRAISAYANNRYAALARRTIHALSQFRALGTFEIDAYNSIWDEYCHEVQHGPHDDLLDDAWDSLIDPVLMAIIEALPRTECVLLTLGANTIVGDRQDERHLGDWVCHENIRQAVARELRGVAINRDLERIRQRPRRASGRAKRAVGRAGISA